MTLEMSWNDATTAPWLFHRCLPPCGNAATCGLSELEAEAANAPARKKLARITTGDPDG